MADLGIAVALGALMGVWRMRQLRGEAQRLVERRGSLVRLLLAGAVMRLLPVVGLIALMLVWSPTAPSVAAALGGFWLGRTATLLREVARPRVKGG